MKTVAAVWLLAHFSFAECEAGQVGQETCDGITSLLQLHAGEAAAGEAAAGDVQNFEKRKKKRVHHAHAGENWKQKYGDENTLILMFASNDYRELVVNQMVRFHELDVTNYAVVCCDDEIADFLDSIGKPCMQTYNISDRKEVWRARLHLISELLQNGTSVVLTDADAVWMKNPLQFLDDADIVTTRGTFPENAYAQFGAAACMGFTYFRSNPAVNDFFLQVLKRFTKDDQVALNYALLDTGLHFEEKVQAAWSSSSPKARQIEMGTIPATETRRELKVRFLDPYRFPRIGCTLDSINEDTVVGHCTLYTMPDKSMDDGNSYASYTADNRMELMTVQGMNFLKDDWESSAATGDLDAYLTSIQM